MTGGIRWRADRARWQVDAIVGGRRVRKSAPDRRSAERLLEELQHPAAQVVRAPTNGSGRNVRVSLKTVLLAYIATLRVRRARNTVRSTDFHSQALLDHFDEVFDVARITQRSLDDFVEARHRAGGAVSSVNGALRILRAALNLAAEEGLLSHSAPSVRLLRESAAYRRSSPRRNWSASLVAPRLASGSPCCLPRTLASAMGRFSTSRPETLTPFLACSAWWRNPVAIELEKTPNDGLQRTAARTWGAFFLRTGPREGQGSCDPGWGPGAPRVSSVSPRGSRRVDCPRRAEGARNPSCRHLAEGIRYTPCGGRGGLGGRPRGTLRLEAPRHARRAPLHPR